MSAWSTTGNLITYTYNTYNTTGAGTPAQPIGVVYPAALLPSQPKEPETNVGWLRQRVEEMREVARAA